MAEERFQDYDHDNWFAELHPNMAGILNSAA